MRPFSILAQEQQSGAQDLISLLIKRVVISRIQGRAEKRISEEGQGELFADS